MDLTYFQQLFQIQNKKALLQMHIFFFFDKKGLIRTGICYVVAAHRLLTTRILSMTSINLNLFPAFHLNRQQSMVNVRCQSVAKASFLRKCTLTVERKGREMNNASISLMGNGKRLGLTCQNILYINRSYFMPTTINITMVVVVGIRRQSLEF